jgi:plasmid stabilization system protein ParE
MLVTKTVRRTTLRRFPYCVYFVMREHDVVVLAVLHGGRKPSAWQRRKAQ